MYPMHENLLTRHVDFSCKIEMHMLVHVVFHNFHRGGSDTLPEWSKGVDSSSTSASCVGSNPTGVNFWPQPGIHIMRYCRCVHNIVSLTFSCLPAACFFTSFMFVCCSAINGSPQCFMCVCRSCLCMSLLCLCELGMFHTYELLCAC